MRKINTIYLWVMMISLLSLTSCGSPYRFVNPHELIQNKDLSFIAPNTQFQIDKDYSKPGENFSKTHLYLVDFNKKILKFKIYTSSYKNIKGNEKFFKRNSYYRNSDIREDRFTKRDKETNVTYKKSWIAYVKGMKCQGAVFSRGFGGSYAPFTSKFYTLGCGYYDKTETKNNGKRFLEIDYIYNADPKHNYEQELKDAVKKAISTLKIKNMDIARMKKAGLLYPHKRFRSTKW